MWQIPLGNTRMRSENNTWGHYQDNRVEWLFDEPARSHLTAYRDAGVVAFLFGGGASGVTCACNAQNDGVTNPAAINGNTMASELAAPGTAPAQVTRGSVPTLATPYAADDDGGFFRWRAWAYYQAGALPTPPRPPTIYASSSSRRRYGLQPAVGWVQNGRTMPMLFLAILASFSLYGTLQATPPPIIGRWDITIQRPDGDRSAWLEVRHSGTSTLVGQFVGMSGSARPISQVEFAGGEMRFTIPPQWERVDGNLVVTGRLDGDRLTGSMTLAGGTPLSWTGVRAPSLRRQTPPQWGTPVPLLNGRDLTGWHAIGTNEWEVANGILRNKKSGGNLVTDQMFTDFKLHAEFRYPAGSNSGVYLRGRYEVQIADTPAAEPSIDGLGAVYGFLAPAEMAAGKPDEWQTFDITLAGRMVTVVLNGKTIICNREIPGITGAALDSHEGAPGPLLLQGDHGPVEFRNMTVALGT